MNDSADLLWVKFGELFRRHVVNKEVVSNLRVGIDTLLMGLSDSLSEDSWILRVEKQVDSR